jgi:hypothetical protein
MNLTAPCSSLATFWEFSGTTSAQAQNVPGILGGYLFSFCWGIFLATSQLRSWRRPPRPLSPSLQGIHKIIANQLVLLPWMEISKN